MDKNKLFLCMAGKVFTIQAEEKVQVKQVPGPAIWHHPPRLRIFSFVSFQSCNLLAAATSGSSSRQASPRQAVSTFDADPNELFAAAATPLPGS
jgi:hypothetical protein